VGPKNGQSCGHAIVWQDTRVAEDVARLSRDLGQDFFRSRTGLPLSTYFSALKLRWMLDSIPGARQRADAGEILFGNIDAFLLWRLTGGPPRRRSLDGRHQCQPTQLMNCKLSWTVNFCACFLFPGHILPRICSSSEVYGLVPRACFRERQWPHLGDQQAALVGQTCFAIGEAKNTYGTGCFLLMKHRRASGTFPNTDCSPR